LTEIPHAPYLKIDAQPSRYPEIATFPELIGKLRTDAERIKIHPEALALYFIPWEIRMKALTTLQNFARRVHKDS
jgi:hypothetical protein